MGTLSALRSRVVLIIENEPLVSLEVAEAITAHGGFSLVVSTAQEGVNALK
jgi:hypothetical protein